MLGSMAVLETGHILVEPVLAGELVGAREVVDSLVRPQTRKSVRSRVGARPKQVVVVARLRHLKERYDTNQNKIFKMINSISSE